MSYTKGVWRVGRGGYCVVSPEPVPEVNGSDAVEYYGGHLIGESMSEANTKRIVECVNACDGMENPADEIAKLRSNIDELLKELDVLSNGYQGNGWDVGLVQRLDSARNLVKKLKEK